MMIPGEIRCEPTDIVLNAGREEIVLTVHNRGDRPVQVGSHFHFFESNPALAFSRESALGMRLNIPAGTAVRFEPGASQVVRLVAIGGARRVFGLNGLTQGLLDDPAVRAAALAKAECDGFLKEKP